jgi:glycosyltransferase involved in cell wall biosynthesis
MLIEAYGVAAVDRVRSRYSWDRIANETIAVYDRVIGQAA